MQDLMVDLEALGTKPGCVVLSIGAVAFDPTTGQLGPSFYEVVNLASCEAAGLVIDPDTAAWWAKQAPEAKVVLDQADSPILSKTLMHALERFTFYLDTLDPQGRVGYGKGVRLWGNGSDFDQPILAAVYHAVGMELPWRFYNNRCYRTLKALVPTVKSVARTGTYHNALDDAVTQALHALRIFEHTNGGLSWVQSQTSNEQPASAPSATTASPTRSSRSPSTPDTQTGSSGCPVGDLF
jgi:3' exoribonuclease, RNase T-like